VRGRSYKYSYRHRLNASSTARTTFTGNYTTSRSETRRVDAVKQKLDVCGRLHLYSNTQRLNAFSAVRDTYTRNKEKGMSVIGQIPRKFPVTSGSLAKRDLQVGARQAQGL